MLFHPADAAAALRLKEANLAAADAAAAVAAPAKPELPKDNKSQGLNFSP